MKHSLLPLVLLLWRLTAAHAFDGSAKEPRLLLTQRRLTAQQTVVQKLTSGICTSGGKGWGYITTASACNQGASTMGWSDTTALIDKSGGWPNGCYLYGTKLFFDGKSSSSGSCSTQKKQCLCKITCQAGHYQDEAKRTSCKTCSAGMYTDLIGQGTCKTCEVGTFQNEIAMAGCKFCMPGQYQNANQASSGCKDCQVGSYQQTSSQSSCSSMSVNLCPPGQFFSSPSAFCTESDSVNIGESECLQKANNQYGSSSSPFASVKSDTWAHVPSGCSVEVEVAAFVLRKAGHECRSSDVQIGTGLSLQQCFDACKNRADCNFFIHGIGNKAGLCWHEETTSASCSEGWNVDQYNFYEILISEAEPHYNRGTGLGRIHGTPFALVTACSTNSFTAGSSASMVSMNIVCPAVITTAQGCIAAAAALRSVGLMPSGLPLQTGGWSHLPTGCSLWNSDEVHWNDYVHPSSKIDFTDSRISARICDRLPSEGSTADDGVCSECPAGWAKSITGLQPCELCVAGKYSNNFLSCTTCPRGTISTADAQNTCVNCLNGQYQNEVQGTSCKTCEKGKYAADLETPCVECQSGRYQSMTLAISYSCGNCSQGQVALDAQTSCSSCTPGRFQELSVATSWGVCKACGQGQVTENNTVSLCEECEAGKFQALTESIVYSCKTCVIGMFSADANTDCKVCPAGWIQPTLIPLEYSCQKCVRNFFFFSSNSLCCSLSLSLFLFFSFSLFPSFPVSLFPSFSLSLFLSVSL